MEITYSSNGCECDWLIYDEYHPFQCFEEAIKSEWKWAAREGGTVAGCGLLLNSKNQLAIFGSLNGILLGQFPPEIGGNAGSQNPKIAKHFRHCLSPVCKIFICHINPAISGNFLIFRISIRHEASYIIDPHFNFTGKQIPLNPVQVELYPTAFVERNEILEANFGTDSAKPFEYDIDKCPGLVFE
jgi:hypothetical protein